MRNELRIWLETAGRRFQEPGTVDIGGLEIVALEFDPEEAAEDHMEVSGFVGPHGWPLMQGSLEAIRRALQAVYFAVLRGLREPWIEVTSGPECRESSPGGR